MPHDITIPRDYVASILELLDFEIGNAEERARDYEANHPDRPDWALTARQAAQGCRELTGHIRRQLGPTVRRGVIVLYIDPKAYKQETELELSALELEALGRMVNEDSASIYGYESWDTQFVDVVPDRT